MVVKAVYIDCKTLTFLGVILCVVYFRVYVSRESSVESICLVRLGFSFLVSWLYISECVYTLFR